MKVKGKIFIFLDEVQNIKNWEIFVNSYSQDFTNDYEIDFIASKDEKTVYLQVTYTLSDKNTDNREYRNLLSIKDNHEKLVVSLDDLKFSDYKGVKHIRPWELIQ